MFTVFVIRNTMLPSHEDLHDCFFSKLNLMPSMWDWMDAR